MKYKITTYRDNGDLWVLELIKKPTLKQLQKQVGGLIEQVPEPYYFESNQDWFKRQHPNKIDAVWCDEEGLGKYNHANIFFTPAPWGDSLWGNVTVVEKIV